MVCVQNSRDFEQALRKASRNQTHRCRRRLVGEHSFSSFRAASCQSRSTLRLIHSIKVERRDKYFVTIDTKTNAFLHHMVHNIIGSLLPIGRWEKAPRTVAELLRARPKTLQRNG
jgi:tRNA pseudouridine38-40 synthase